MSKKYLLIAIVLGTGAAHAATVTRSGQTILVDGQPFTIKGVNYSPAPVGYTVALPATNCTGPYHWWQDRPTYVADFKQIRYLGANTIRTYDLMNSSATATQVRQALDAAHANGLYVVMGYFVQYFLDVSQPGVRSQAQAEFLAAVNAYKDHPAVLMWVFGNENNLNNGNTNANWYTLLQQVATAAKAADPNHLIMTAEGECRGPDCGLPAGTDFSFLKNIGNAGINADDASLTALDVWGVNVYRGRTFEGVIEALDISTMTAKPIVITEFGKDAYRDSSAAEDQALQGSYLSSQWSEINSNLSASGAGRANLAGGIVFEWNDEWWKDSTNDCVTHGHEVLFRRLDDTADPNYQDEWFGLTSVQPINPISNNQGTVRTQRSGFAALQAFWNPSVATATSAAAVGFFADTVRNYPNPFQVGAAPTRFVAYVNAPGTIDVSIYDASAQFVTSLPPANATGAGRYELIWDGRNRQGQYVSAGLYHARIEGKSGQRQDKQYRRVVAVK